MIVRIFIAILLLREDLFEDALIPLLFFLPLLELLRTQNSHHFFLSIFQSVCGFEGGVGEGVDSLSLALV
jgi:hypothetical protein